MRAGLPQRRLSGIPTPLPGLQVVTRHPVGDARGFLARVFCADELGMLGWQGGIAQVNHAGTHGRGTVRGLHYQRAPHAEIKLVSCVRGAVWDVAVDLRPDSPTYLRWHAEELAAENHRALLIPQGFAHGFQALTEEVELLYCHSAPYCAPAEGGLHAQDPALAIAWPLPVQRLSARDAGLPCVGAGFEGVRP